MSIAEKLQASKDALDALLTYANDATSAGDTDIGEAIRTLVDGYGKGGESSVLLGEGDVTPTVEDYGITFGDNIELPQDKSIAYVIYDDGTSGAVSARTYMIAYAYGYLDKDLFEWKRESDTYTNRLYPKMRFPLKFNDGDIPAWGDSQTYAQSGGAVIRSSSGTFYTGLGYGALRYNIDSKNFTISRGNSSYSFTPNRTYHYKVYAVGDSAGGGSGDCLVESFDIEIPTQTTVYDIYLSKPCDMVSIALKETPSELSTTAWMIGYDSTVNDCGIYGVPEPTARYRFINNTSWQWRWSGTSHVHQAQSIIQSSLRQELMGEQRYYAHIYRNAASYPILAGTYEVKTYKRYAD